MTCENLNVVKAVEVGIPIHTSLWFDNSEYV